MIPKFYKDIGARLVCIKKGTKSPAIPAWTKIEDRYDEASKKFDPNVHNKVGWILDDTHLVIDIDTHDPSKDGYAALQRLSDDLGVDLYERATVVVKSPSGGAHLYFWKDPDIKLPKSSKEYAGLDFLSAGSQVIIAGSSHDDHAGSYVFERESEFIAPVMTATLHECLSDSRPDSNANVAIEPSEDRPGDEFNKSERALEHVKSHMSQEGYSFKHKGDHYEFTRPGKTDTSFAISGTLGRKSKQGNYILRNFSTSDPVFPSDASITIFEAFRLINHWDRDQVTLHASDLGFGSQIDVSEIEESVDDWLAKIPETKNRVDQLPSYEIAKRVLCRTFDELGEISSGLRRPYVIEGLIRTGEVMNVIAAPKVGKSWLVYNLAVSTACGREFLGYRASKNLKVLLIDNELHWEELAWRVHQVAGNMAANPHDALTVSCVRGMDISLAGIEKLLDEIDGEQFDLIIIDALYRVLPKGASENDNAQMTQLYNRIDQIAGKNNTAVICIHHTSKGAQGGKDVTDVGAGAGAINRAADTILTIRPHRDDPYFVINALTRSGQSPEPIVAEFDWPVWMVAPDVTPELQDDSPPKKQSAKEVNTGLCLDLIRRDSETSIKDLAEETGLSEGSIRSYCKQMQDDGLIEIEKRPYKPSIIRDASDDRSESEEWQPE